MEVTEQGILQLSQSQSFIDLGTRMRIFSVGRAFSTKKTKPSILATLHLHESNQQFQLLQYHFSLAYFSLSIGGKKDGNISVTIYYIMK